MGLFETLNRLGVLSVGRRPEWKIQNNTDGPPSSAGDGVSIAGSVKTLVSLSLREDAAFHTARISIGQDSLTMYSVTVDGTAETVVGEADADDTLTALALSLNTNATIALVATASVEGDELVLLGVGAAAFPVVVGVSGGTGTIDVIQDATEATAYVYLLAGGLGARPPQWTLARNGTLDVDARGLTERLDTAGFDRMYVEVVADGTCTVAIGPGVIE